MIIATKIFLIAVTCICLLPVLIACLAALCGAELTESQQSAAFILAMIACVSGVLFYGVEERL